MYAMSEADFIVRQGLGQIPPNVNPVTIMYGQVMEDPVSVKLFEGRGLAGV